MGNIVFVHGTGVRQPSYDITCEAVAANLRRFLPNYDLQRCYWGEEEGSRLRSGGVSIPTYDSTRGTAEVEAADLAIARWNMLYEDPTSELNGLLSPTAATNAFVPGSQTLLESIVELLQTENQNVRDLVCQTGLERVWQQAKMDLVESINQMIKVTTQELDSEVRAAFARSLVARALTMAFGVPGERADWPTGRERDALVEALCELWGGSDRSVTSWTSERLKRMALKIGTSRVARKRGAISDAAYPAAGDVLLYQARGQGIRNFIEDTINKTRKPLLLLAHSLGGIACFDLLVEKQIEGITMLITVGSQAPLLYELDALHSLRHGSNLPDWFPRWINIYDPHDFLSYIGNSVFKSRVTDIAVDNGQPFPESHSAYWHNPSVWEAIARGVTSEAN
jgi:hypothetical protein